MIPRIPAALPLAYALVVALAAPAIAAAPQAAAPQPAAPQPAAPQPAAMVESLSQPIAGIAAMDYLAAGQTITLAPDATLVLDYLASCTRETITGGTVHVGEQASTIEHGHLARRRLDCDGNDLQLTAAQSDAGGVAVYRAIGRAAPALTLRGSMPVIVARGAGPIRIERLDTEEPPRDLAVPAAGRQMVDLAASRTLLAPGGLYRVTQGSRSVVVRIAADAAPGALPLVLRLLPL
jgi:hypothetical protein